MSRILPDYNQLMRFTINDVCNWLGENRFGEFVRMFREHGIDGNRFVTLTDLDLTKMSCPMNKRKDLLKLIKELPKQDPSRVKNVMQQRVPPTPDRDYKTLQQRPPPPVPAETNLQQNGAYDSDDGSGPEDDYEWAPSDFSDVSSDDEEDYENNPPAMEIPRRPPVQPPPDEDSDASVGSYEEPDPQSVPPPTIPGRGGPSAPRVNSIPVNRRPVPLIPKEEEQPVYEDPDEKKPVQPVQPVKKTFGRKQLPIPMEQPRKITQLAGRQTSEPDVVAPPPPRSKGKNRKLEQTAPPPALPPCRGPRKAAPPPEVVEPISDDVYEDPDQSAGSPSNDQEPSEHYWEPIQEQKSPLPSPIPPSRGSAFHGLGLDQEVYEDPDASAPAQPKLPPSRIRVLPGVPKLSQPKPPQPTKKIIPKQEEPQLEYEVPDEILRGEIPTDHYMEMQAAPETLKTKQAKKVEKTSTLPPPPRNRAKPALPTEPSQPDHKPNTGHRTKAKPVPQPADNSVSLEDQTWYHDEIERSIADSKLLGIGSNGCFLIRKSKKGGETKPYTLAILFGGQVFNLNIRKKPNKQYALGMAKSNEQEFSDLSELVVFFKSHRLILAKGQTRLKTPCPK